MDIALEDHRGISSRRWLPTESTDLSFRNPAYLCSRALFDIAYQGFQGFNGYRETQRDQKA